MIDTAPATAEQLSPEALAQVRIFQQNEVTESEVYRRIAAGTKDENNRAALLCIADEEAKHAGISLGVAALSFVIGILVKQFLGVDI